MYTRYSNLTMEEFIDLYAAAIHDAEIAGVEIPMDLAKEAGSRFDETMLRFEEIRRITDV